MQSSTVQQGLNSTWESIVERTAIFEQAMANSDAYGVANCYTEDAEFMAPGAPAVKGRANIQTTMAGYIQQGFTQYKVTSTTVWNHIDIVGVQASYTLSQQGGANQDIGKTIQLWKQENGVWKIFRDCFNSDLPAQS
jgi:uncharacterized protein (TIGR02246 family)